MAFTLKSEARHFQLLTTRQTSRNAADRTVAPPIGLLTLDFDPACSQTTPVSRHSLIPDQAASLLPGLLTATRTGLTPASDDELMHQSCPHRTPPLLWAYDLNSYRLRRIPARSIA